MENNQQGVALAITLIFLLLITIIGISTFRGTTINELISSNTQLKSTAFQVSESVIESVWDSSYILQKTPADVTQTAAIILNEDKSAQPFNSLFNIPANGSAAAIDVSANASLQYCGEETIALNYQLSADESDNARQAAHIYSIHGIGLIDTTHARADHDQRGFIVRNAAGRTGNCP